ncbi:hypothetical protein JVT61DRAFT_8622 [Boletus reticuloceps]|uniref:RING-type domain-containing protein n=1 Tax=Boletus reticuloceps TaxID=495285 RepID=A0A8I2YZG5_9AGAM|nr:hypothetical protein JVT61DRAFT_8622 [Boletus reticuloceps]
MLCQRLSALFTPDHGGGSVVKDVLSGKERILPLVDARRYPCRTLSACHFAALNFVRVAFQHVQRTRGSSNPSMARWLGTVMDRHVVEELLSPREQLIGTQAIRLEEMHRVPLFEGALRHVATQHSPPSMILFKQSLRQMQLHPSPVSAIVVNRSASTTVCLKLREHSKDVFCVLDFALAPQEHVRRHGTALALVISTSLEQTAARMSGNLPIDNHLMTRDRQWQAQLFGSCTMCMFTPAEGAAWLSEAESSATISGSVSLLRIMDEIDDRGRDWGTSDQPSGSKHSERWARTPFDAGRTATTSRRHASHVEDESIGEGSSARMAGLRPRTTFTPYEQTKRHCRIFLSDDELASPMSPISRLSEASDEEAYFECVICFEDIPEGQGIRLLPCTHGFCRDCLAGHVCSKIEERKFPVFCPLCMTEHENASPSGEPTTRRSHCRQSANEDPKQSSPETWFSVSAYPKHSTRSGPSLRWRICVCGYIVAVSHKVRSVLRFSTRKITKDWKNSPVRSPDASIPGAKTVSKP